MTWQELSSKYDIDRTSAELAVQYLTELNLEPDDMTCVFAINEVVRMRDFYMKKFDMDLNFENAKYIWHEIDPQQHGDVFISPLFDFTPVG